MIRVIGATILLGIIGWIYQRLKKAPPPRICGSANGPPLSSPRVKLNDGRHLAYRELGVPKEKAQYKIILCHGLDSCKDMDLPISQVLLPCIIFFVNNMSLINFRTISTKMCMQYLIYRKFWRSLRCTYYCTIELVIMKVIQIHHVL